MMSGILCMNFSRCAYVSFGISEGNDSTVSEPYKSPDDLLDTLTDDQINRLSCEFDRRAQDDGVIKSETESREDLDSIDYHNLSKAHDDAHSKLERKTSYTEIKLSQPANNGKY